MNRIDILKICNLELISNIDINSVPSNEKFIFIDGQGYKYFLSINNLQNFLKRKSKDPASELAKFYRGNIFTKDNIALFIKNSGKQIHIKDNIGKTATTNFTLVCEIHHIEFQMSWNCIKNGQGCPQCGKEMATKKKTHTIEWIKKEAIQRFGINIISKNYESNLTRLDFYCLKHPNIVQTKSWAQMLNSRHPCSKCSEELLKKKYENYETTTACAKNPKVFLRQMKEIYGDKYEFLEEYKTSNDKIKIKCNNCGKVFYGTPKHLLNGHACGCCRSRGEEKIKAYLDKVHIDYIEQKRFKDCYDKKPLSYDFFVPCCNLLIEFQGKQHYCPSEQFGGEEQFLIQKKHDCIKKNYAMKNGFNFLEITYKDYYKIEDILNKVFKLGSVF